jgi:hypothetical protein
MILNTKLHVQVGRAEICINNANGSRHEGGKHPGRIRGYPGASSTFRCARKHHYSGYSWAGHEKETLNKVRYFLFFESFQT